MCGHANEKSIEDTVEALNHRCAMDAAHQLADDLLTRASRATGPAPLAAELLEVEDLFDGEVPQHEVLREDVHSWWKSSGRRDSPTRSRRQPVPETTRKIVNSRG